MQANILEILEHDNDEQLDASIDKSNDIIPNDAKDLPQFLQHSPTIIAAAAYYGAIRCYNKLLEKGFDVNKEDAFCTPISHFSVIGGNQEIMNDILKREVSFSRAVFVAIENKKIDSLKWLKEHNLIHINETDARGFNIGMCAALTNDEETIKYAYETCNCFPAKLNDETNIITFLLKSNLDKATELTLKMMKNLNLNERDKSGDTPLSIATRKGKTEIVKLINNYGKSVVTIGETKKAEENKNEKKKSKCCTIF